MRKLSMVLVVFFAMAIGAVLGNIAPVSLANVTCTSVWYEGTRASMCKENGNMLTVHVFNPYKIESCSKTTTRDVNITLAK